MQYPIIYHASTVEQLRQRVDQLAENSTPKWGTMNAAQMLAHLNAAFDLSLSSKQKKPNAFVRWILQKMLKPKLISPTPYAQNSQTAPAMKIKGQRNFTAEKNQLFLYFARLADLGEKGFNQKIHPSFGAMSSSEWSIFFFKHIDHHLRQFNC